MEAVTHRRSSRWGRWLGGLVLVFAPVAVHVLAYSLSASASRWGKTDWTCTALAAIYLFMCGLAFAVKRLPHLLLMIYSSLAALVIAELALQPMVPLPRARLPWPPLVRTGIAGDAMPGIEGEIKFSINDLGVRGPQLPLESADVRILCVGGSTTECFYVTDQKSWPWRLQDKLQEKLQKRVLVGNAGRSGAFTLHHTYLIDHYDLVSDFDCVIVLCGINDLGSLLRRTYDQRRARVPVETLTPDLSQLVYYRRLALHRLASRYFESLQSYVGQVVQDEAGSWYQGQRIMRQRALRQKTIDTPPPDFENALTRYRKNLRDVIAACRRRGVRLVMMTQPTLYDAQMPEELQRLLIVHCEDHAYTPAVLRHMIDRYNAAMVDVCREAGVDCIDLAGELPKDTTVFYDDCHFNIGGCEKVATVIANHWEADWASGRMLPAIARGKAEGASIGAKPHCPF